MFLSSCGFCLYNLLMLLIFAHCRCMFGNSRNVWQGQKEVNYREEEKKILDSVLSVESYDKRIRPSGLNSTGKHFIIVTLYFSITRYNTYTHSFILARSIFMSNFQIISKYIFFWVQ